jgi:hypothetical protein
MPFQPLDHCERPAMIRLGPPRSCHREGTRSTPPGSFLTEFLFKAKASDPEETAPGIHVHNPSPFEEAKSVRGTSNGTDDPKLEGWTLSSMAVFS